MADDKTFTCDACGGTFPEAWSDAEAEAEYQTLFPSHASVPKEDRAVVCDDCFKQMTAEYPPEQFEREVADDRVLHGNPNTPRPRGVLNNSNVKAVEIR